MAGLLNGFLSTGCREEIWAVYTGEGQNQDVLKVQITYAEFKELSLFVSWCVLENVSLCCAITSH